MVTMIHVSDIQIKIGPDKRPLPTSLFSTIAEEKAAIIFEAGQGKKINQPNCADFMMN